MKIAWRVHNLKLFLNIFAKGYVANLSEGVFLIKKIQNTVLPTSVISDLKLEGTAENSSKKHYK